jgi:hypothetical protein
VAFSADMFLKIKTVCLLNVIPEMLSFQMRPSKYFYDKLLPKYLDSKTVIIYRPHPVFGTDPNRIGLLGKPPAVKHSFPSKSR